MNRDSTNFLANRRRISLFGGLLLTIFGGLYFFNVSASAGKIDKPSAAQQNLALGRLAFTRLQLSSVNPQSLLGTANADGTGIVLSMPSPISFDPVWSP